MNLTVIPEPVSELDAHIQIFELHSSAARQNQNVQRLLPALADRNLPPSNSKCFEAQKLLLLSSI